MAGRYTGSYLDRSNGWRAVATLADIGRASLVGRIPNINYDSFNATTTRPRSRKFWQRSVHVLRLSSRRSSLLGGSNWPVSSSRR
jgi:hypothetical protein